MHFHKTIRTTEKVETFMALIDSAIEMNVADTNLRWRWREAKTASRKEAVADRLYRRENVRFTGETTEGDLVTVVIYSTGYEEWLDDPQWGRGDNGDPLRPRRLVCFFQRGGYDEVYREKCLVDDYGNIIVDE